MPNPKKRHPLGSVARWLKISRPVRLGPDPSSVYYCVTSDKLHHPSGPQFLQTKNKDNSDSISSLVVWNQ